MRTRLQKLLLAGLGAALAAALFATCKGLEPVPEGTSGPDMYLTLACADCHGPRGEGNEKGPPLRDLRSNWILERNLADYLADPVPFQTGDPRVRWLWGKYSFDMPAYIHLSFEQRMSFAAWLFTLE